MNLRDKLRAVGGTGGNRQPAAEPAERDCRHFAVYRPAEEFPGALELSRETLALMSDKEMPENFDPRRILYLDTETTGLGGSGTVAFLVGMGFLTDNGFEVHQFLMRDYPEEPYLLKHVAAGLGKFDVLCTFNGTTFDVPLLEDILKHNAQDIASLCVLLNHMADLYLHPEKIRFSEDVYSMGRALEKVNQTEPARRCYRLASRGRMGDLASAALAVSYRRGGQREEAAEVWREMIRENRGGVAPYVELAKYEEHIRRNIPEALRLTEQAIIRLSEPGFGQDNAVQENQNELQYRWQRLKRKLKEQNEHGFSDTD